MPAATFLRHRTTTRSIVDLQHLYRGGHLNLEPGFQRQSVWRQRDRIAWDWLQAFAIQVAEVRELQRKARGARPDQELHRDHLLTVSQMTDDVSQRRKREQIMRGILESLFARRDNQRGFTAEQRRIAWSTSAQRTCTYPGCRKRLSWEDFTIDHIQPHGRGGRSRLENAASMCRQHKSRKGNRRR